MPIVFLKPQANRQIPIDERQYLAPAPYHQHGQQTEERNPQAQRMTGDEVPHGE
jgi:hypothetical protein